jgi:tetratricopeptide (TPR) repeat protein
MSEASRILARALPAFRGRETATTLALATLILAAPTQRMIAHEAARARHDPRIALTAWIEANIPEGERLALEPGGPFPSVERFSLERVDFLGRHSAEEYRARGVRYLIGSGRESRIVGEPSFAPVLDRLVAIREGSDRLWEQGRYVVYRLRVGSRFWEDPAREALAAGDFGRARAILEEGMAGDSAAPTPHGWKLLGEVRAVEGDTSAALAAYAEAARLDPGDVEIPLAAGNLHLEVRAWDRALEEFSLARDLAPRDPLVFHNLAVAHLYRARERWRSGARAAAREDWLAAREHADAVVKFAPGDPDLGRIREQVSRAGRSWGFEP